METMGPGSYAAAIRDHLKNIFIVVTTTLRLIITTGL
jgi:hypothetical protein